MRNWMKGSIILIIIIALFQAGLSVLANVESQTSSMNSLSNQSEKAQTMYKQFLIDYEIHSSLQETIEQWLEEGSLLSDVLIAYSYVYHQFGVIENVETMLVHRKQDMKWAEIFRDYKSTHQEFVPRAFDSEVLERLNNSLGISSDDIMLADMISYITNLDVEMLIEQRMERNTWQEITAQAGILYSSEELPRVALPMEELQTYLQATNLSEEQIAAGYVLAHKTAASVQSVLERMDTGADHESIFAEELIDMYSIE